MHCSPQSMKKLFSVATIHCVAHSLKIPACMRHKFTVKIRIREKIWLEMMQVEAKRKCVFAGIRPFLFGEFGASPRCKFPVKCVLPGYISPFVSSKQRLCRCCLCSRGGNAAQVERGFQKYRALRITYTCSLLKKKKSNFTHNSHIASPAAGVLTI